MKIGELARRAGVNASAIRYYEKLGLVAPAMRSAGQRRYTDDADYRVQLICFASDMGFTLAEIKVFLSGLRGNAPMGPRWRQLAHRKIAETERTIDRTQRLKALLEQLLKCECASLNVCVERLSLSPALKEISGDGQVERAHLKRKIPATNPG